MDTNMTHQTYTIMETAKLSGLPESTLRYYETIGLIHHITRDSSSKHRVYSEDDVNYVIALACLNALDMSIEDMRSYLANRSQGARAAQEQVQLLVTQKKRMADEAKLLKLRQKYVETKIAYWDAILDDDQVAIEAARSEAYTIARQLQLPESLGSDRRA